jgi:hypothetical protein
MEHIKSFQSFTSYMSEVKTKQVEEEKAAKQAQYSEFFKSKLQEYGVATPSELDEEKRNKFYNEINSWTGDSISESLNEANVKDKESFKEYVYAIYKKAFGDKFDPTKADKVIDGLIKKHKEDWGAMIGAVTSTLGESLIEDSKDLSELNEVELSSLQKEYKEYFSDLLKEFGVKSQGELSEEKKKEFFKKVKAGWEKGKGKKV